MKFFVYKRGGHRVIINKMGDLIVRPNPMEASLRLLPCAGSVQQHLLTSYLQSFVAIMVAQFKPTRGPKTDMLAVLDLLRHNAVLTVSSLATCTQQIALLAPLLIAMCLALCTEQTCGLQ